MEKEMPEKILCSNCALYINKEVAEEIHGGVCECCKHVVISWVRKERVITDA